MCDRIYVMDSGRIIAEFPQAEATRKDYELHHHKVRGRSGHECLWTTLRNNFRQ